MSTFFQGGAALLLGVAAMSAGAAPPRIFLDTDIGPDVDDVAAVAILHALADAGEAEIVAMAACTSSEWGAPCLQALNDYYGRPDIPLGTFKEEGFLLESPYSEGVVRAFPESLREGREIPDAIELYRRVLAEQPDGELMIIALGPLNNLARLLDTTADEHSPLSGVDLVKAKVRELVIMGPYFNEEGEFQYAWNYAQDPESAWQVMQRWPTPMRFGEGNLGHRHFIGSTLAQAPEDSPVRKAFELAEGPGGKRHCADPSTILYAIRGTRHFDEVTTGSCETRREDGFTRWVASPDLDHAHNTQKGTVEELEAVLEDLLTRPPARK